MADKRVSADGVVEERDTAEAEQWEDGADEASAEVDAAVAVG